MVPSGTPGSFIAAARQCRSNGQRQHIPAAYPRSTLPWQHIAVVRSRAAGRGNISPWCVFGRRSVASFRRGAFPGSRSWHHSAAVPFSGARRWQNAREMRSPGVRQWQDIAAMRFRAVGHGSISPRCVFGGPVVARLCRGAFPGGDPWRLFRFMRSRRGLGREKRPFLAAYRRRASETSRLRQDIRAVHPKSPANGRSGMHRAKILP